MNQSPTVAVVSALAFICLFGCQEQAKQTHHEEHAHKVVVTSPQAQDVVLTQKYVCQIHSQRHIDVCALEDGYLEQIPIKEGQAVKKGDLLFKILPTLYQAKLDARLAAVRAARVQLEQSKNLLKDKVVSQVDVALREAELAKAQAEVQESQAELNFTSLNAPFDGIVDRLLEREGSLLKEGDMLTSLSDNSVMWVYFNVPERDYLEYMAGLEREQALSEGADDESLAVSKEPGDDGKTRGEVSQKVELMLANHAKFPQAGKIGAIEANFDNETGNIPFRADFLNPNGLLRHGQTGTVILSHILHGGVVIPQRATYEILAKTVVYPT